MATTYIAMKRLLIGDAWREPGDEVPEAADWPTLRSYLQGEHIKEVPAVVAPTPAPVNAEPVAAVVKSVTKDGR